MPTAVSTLPPLSLTEPLLPGIARGGEVACLRRAGDFQGAPRAHFDIKEFL
ncbi:hypothetical protein [Pseudomonas sp. RA_35y_Pfl2_P32]|uniref:hypothetical protein n=1 Tax=Pseudomonas sp. RA_35y_Pfl2_P32 TaxID=3088705 RepID=UPI0030DD549F